MFMLHDKCLKHNMTKLALPILLGLAQTALASDGYWQECDRPADADYFDDSVGCYSTNYIWGVVSIISGVLCLVIQTCIAKKYPRLAGSILPWLAGISLIIGGSGAIFTGTTHQFAPYKQCDKDTNGYNQFKRWWSAGMASMVASGGAAMLATGRAINYCKPCQMIAKTPASCCTSYPCQALCGEASHEEDKIIRKNEKLIAFGTVGAMGLTWWFDALGFGAPVLGYLCLFIFGLMQLCKLKDDPTACTSGKRWRNGQCPCILLSVFVSGYLLYASAMFVMDKRKCGVITQGVDEEGNYGWDQCPPYTAESNPNSFFHDRLAVGSTLLGVTAPFAYNAFYEEPKDTSGKDEPEKGLEEVKIERGNAEPEQKASEESREPQIERGSPRTASEHSRERRRLESCENRL